MRVSSRISDNVSSGTVQRCLPALFILSCGAVSSPPRQCRTISMEPPSMRARRSRAMPCTGFSWVFLPLQPGPTKQSPDRHRAASGAAAPSPPKVPAASPRARQSRARAGAQPVTPRSSGVPTPQSPDDWRDQPHHIDGGHTPLAVEGGDHNYTARIGKWRECRYFAGKHRRPVPSPSGIAAGLRRARIPRGRLSRSACPKPNDAACRPVCR
jgi:hypothetical protein